MKLHLIPWLILATATGAIIPFGNSLLMGKERPDTNLVMILVDGMRADAISNAAGSAHTPNLDRLTRTGMAFPTTFSHSSSPDHALAALMTGRNCDDINLNADGSGHDAPRLAEWLSRRGYQTSAVVMEPMLDDSDLLRGFTHREVVATSSFREGKSEWSESLDNVLGNVDPNQAFFFMGHMKWGDRLQDALMDGAGDPAEHLAETRHQYKRSVEDLDRAVGQVIQMLKDRGLYDNTLVVITSLRGLSLGEHGLVGERPSLYDETLHVPMILRLPLETDFHKTLGANHLRFTRHVDVTPTIIDLLGVAEIAGTEGVSLLHEHQRVLHAIEGGASGTRAMRDDQYKLVYSSETAEFQMFNLAQDPAELDNVFHVQGHLRTDWQSRLRGAVTEETPEELHASAAAPADTDELSDIDEAVEREPVVD